MYLVDLSWVNCAWNFRQSSSLTRICASNSRRKSKCSFSVAWTKKRGIFIRIIFGKKNYEFWKHQSGKDKIGGKRQIVSAVSEGLRLARRAHKFLFQRSRQKWNNSGWLLLSVRQSVLFLLNIVYGVCLGIQTKLQPNDICRIFGPKSRHSI